MVKQDMPDSGYGSEHRRHSRLRHWKLKAAIQTILSVTPGGARTNYWFQRWVTRTLPISDVELRSQVAKAQRNLSAYVRVRRLPLSEIHLYEFGAGWDLLLPLVYWSMGVNRQTVVDIRPLARSALVLDTAKRLNEGADEFGLERKLVPPAGRGRVAELLRTWGIDYQAPGDARSVDLPAGSVDLITSTDVLEHVPLPDIRTILPECRRLLSPDGLMRIRIDYQDHYWYFDDQLSPYHFLRFEPDEWRRYNPPLHFQNRIRHPEFLHLVAESGMEILEDDHPEPTRSDLNDFDIVELARPFRSLPARDAAIRFANLTLGQRSGG